LAQWRLVFRFMPIPIKLRPAAFIFCATGMKSLSPPTMMTMPMCENRVVT
jgi:hypothetical protein